MRRILSNRGFTLIEILAVMILLMTLGVVISVILITSLRGSSKAALMATVRENGSFAINIMTRKIRFARAFQGVSADDITYITDCSPSGPPKATYYFAKFETFNLETINYACIQTVPKSIKMTIVAQSGSATTRTLIDPQTVGLISCQFTCDQTTVSAPHIIGIDFSLSQKNPSSFVEQTSPIIPFQTSVTMRNFLQ